MNPIQIGSFNTPEPKKRTDGQHVMKKKEMYLNLGMIPANL